MSKLSLLLTSLVAAIPGGYLTYLMVMTFLDRADQMSGMLMGLVGLTLAMSACVTLTPFGIAIFTPKGEKVASAGTAQEEADVDVDEDLDEDLDGEAGGFGDDPIPDDFEVEDSGAVDDVETGDLETFEYEVDGDDDASSSDDDFDMGDDDVFAEDDDNLSDFDLDFDEDEN